MNKKLLLLSCLLALPTPAAIAKNKTNTKSSTTKNAAYLTAGALTACTLGYFYMKRTSPKSVNDTSLLPVHITTAADAANSEKSMSWESWENLSVNAKNSICATGGLIIGFFLGHTSKPAA